MPTSDNTGPSRLSLYVTLGGLQVLAGLTETALTSAGYKG